MLFWSTFRQWTLTVVYQFNDLLFYQYFFHTMVSDIFYVNVSATSGGNSSSITCTGEWLPVESICRLSPLQLCSLPAGLYVCERKKNPSATVLQWCEKTIRGFHSRRKGKKENMKGSKKDSSQISPQPRQSLAAFPPIWMNFIHPSIHPSKSPHVYRVDVDTIYTITISSFCHTSWNWILLNNNLCCIFKVLWSLAGSSWL